MTYFIIQVKEELWKSVFKQHVYDRALPLAARFNSNGGTLYHNRHAVKVYSGGTRQDVNNSIAVVLMKDYSHGEGHIEEGLDILQQNGIWEQGYDRFQVVVHQGTNNTLLARNKLLLAKLSEHGKPIQSVAQPGSEIWPIGTEYQSPNKQNTGSCAAAVLMTENIKLEYEERFSRAISWLSDTKWYPYQP